MLSHSKCFAMDDSSRRATGYPAPNYPQAHNSTTPNGHSSTATATATAYPYAAPPPAHPHYYTPNPNPNPYYAPDPYAAQRATFFRRIFAVLIASVIIAGTVIFVVWLVLRPRIPEFRVDSLTLSNFNLSSNSLISGDWEVRFTVRNPNTKITLAYDHVQAYLFYKSETISQNMVPPFVQGTKTETAVRTSFAASSYYVDKWVVDGINGERTHGRINFNVRMLARVRFKAGSWRARRRFLRVLCDDLVIGVSRNSANGSLVGGSTECGVVL